MKTTLGMNYRMLSSHLENISSKMYRLREQSTTGKKVNKPSDDPGAIRPILNYRTQIQTTGRYLNHIQMAKGEMELLDSNLDQVESIMVRAKELGISAINGAANDEDIRTFANQVNGLFKEMLQIANGQTNGKYVFSGYLDKTVPFAENTAYDSDDYHPADSSTWPVEYNGDKHARTLEVAPEMRIQVGLTGNELFLGDADNDQAVDSGSLNLFAVLKNFEDALVSNNTAEMNTGLEQLEQGAEQVRRLRGQMGNNAQRIERAEMQLNEASIEFKEVLSSYEDADWLDVFSQLVQQETAFEAALNVTSRVSKLSILNFM